MCQCVRISINEIALREPFEVYSYFESRGCDREGWDEVCFFGCSANELWVHLVIWLAHAQLGASINRSTKVPNMLHFLISDRDDRETIQVRHLWRPL